MDETVAHRPASPTPSGPPAEPARLSGGSALPAGTRLREFVVRETIGEGGFSVVYAALDTRLGREVAIKEYIPASLAGRAAGTSVHVRSEQHRESFAAGLAGFMNEARLLAQFKHPALVEVLQFWEDNGTAYMVMPRYRGATLRQVLKDRSHSCDENWLKRTLAPILDVLDLLHSRKVFHRDVAPDNILVQPDGRAVLLDLGSAREILGDRESAVTVVVKPGYAPLEQYSGEFALPQGPWTDVYAFGALLHFAVTGSPPQASISRIMKDGREPLAGTPHPGFSEEFLAGIDAALALQPAQRPQSARALRELLGFDRITESAPRPGAEAALAALHHDEAITAIVSAEELAGIVEEVARAAGGPVPEALASAAGARAEARADTDATGSPEAVRGPIPGKADSATTAIADPMAPPPPNLQAEAPAEGSFDDVADLMRGSLLSDTRDVRVVSECRLEARSDASAEPADSNSGHARRGLWIAISLASVLGGGLALWYGLSAGAGETDSTEPNPAVAETPQPAPAPSLEHRPSLSERLAAVEAPDIAGAPADAPGAELSTADGSPPTANAWPSPPQPAEATPIADAGAETAAHSTDTPPSPVPASIASTRSSEAPPSEHALSPPPRPDLAIPAAVWSPSPVTPNAVTEAETPSPDRADNTNATRSTPRTPPRPRATALQTVRVNVLPWAEVWVDGRKLGVSPPLRELQLEPGLRRIELRNTSFPARSFELQIEPGQNPVVEHRFSE